MAQSRRLLDSPPHNADDWWPQDDPAVGTADIGSNYLWDVRVRLQLKIEESWYLACTGCCTGCGYPRDPAEGQPCACCGRPIHRIVRHTIVDARCHVEDDDANGPEPDISAAIVAFLKGRETWRALDLKNNEPPPDPGVPRPMDVMWHVGFAEDAVKEALRDWAEKDPRKRPLPEGAEPDPPPGRTLGRWLRGLLGF